MPKVRAISVPAFSAGLAQPQLLGAHGVLLGWDMAESTGAAAAVATLADGGTAEFTIPIRIASGLDQHMWFGLQAKRFEHGLVLTWTSGSFMAGTVWWAEENIPLEVNVINVGDVTINELPPGG